MITIKQSDQIADCMEQKYTNDFNKGFSSVTAYRNIAEIAALRRTMIYLAEREEPEFTETQWLAEYHACVARLEQLRDMAQKKWTGPNKRYTKDWDTTTPDMDDNHMETFYSVRATSIIFSKDHKLQ